MSTWKNKIILIVEDEYSNYYLLKKIVELRGAATIWVTNGRDAVNTMNEEQDIDMILMDLKLPVMNGLDATRKIKENYPKTPIIAVTAHAMKTDRKMALSAGCDDYIAKPLKKAQLPGEN
ncbi:MAG: response regulator [Bacteroidales bacterium]|nr:response regulator [Bacteroidales bacterium]